MFCNNGSDSNRRNRTLQSDAAPPGMAFRWVVKNACFFSAGQAKFVERMYKPGFIIIYLAIYMQLKRKIFTKLEKNCEIITR